MAALHYASHEGYANIVEVLVNHNADMNIVTEVIQIIRMGMLYCNL